MLNEVINNSSRTKMKKAYRTKEKMNQAIHKATAPAGSKFAKDATLGRCTVKNHSAALASYFYNLRYAKTPFAVKVM